MWDLSFLTKDQTHAPLHWKSVCVCVFAQVCMFSVFVMLGTEARQAPLSLGLSRQEYWSRVPFTITSGDLPDLGIVLASLASPALADRFFVISARREVPGLEAWSLLMTGPPGESLGSHFWPIGFGWFLTQLWPWCLPLTLLPSETSGWPQSWRNWTISPSLAFFLSRPPNRKKRIWIAKIHQWQASCKVRQKKRKGDGAGAAQEEEGDTTGKAIRGVPGKWSSGRKEEVAPFITGGTKTKMGLLFSSKER